MKKRHAPQYTSVINAFFNGRPHRHGQDACLIIYTGDARSLLYKGHLYADRCNGMIRITLTHEPVGWETMRAIVNRVNYITQRCIGRTVIEISEKYLSFRFDGKHLNLSRRLFNITIPDGISTYDELMAYRMMTSGE